MSVEAVASVGAVQPLSMPLATGLTIPFFKSLNMKHSPQFNIFKRTVTMLCYFNMGFTTRALTIFI